MPDIKNAISLFAWVLTSTFAVSAIAANGTITFNGKVTDTTCSIAVNGGTENATVTLPTVSSNSLKILGETAGATPFNISLTACSGTALGTASTYFEPGTYVDSTTGRLNIDSTVSDAAKNVQVELLNASMDPIIAGTSVANGQNDIAVDISAGSGTLNYFARYYATAQSVAGSVATQIDYTMTYE